MKTEKVLLRAQQLCTARHHSEALNLLKEAIRESTQVPEYHAEAGRLLCLLQREMEALDHVGPANSAELAQTLADYLECRHQCAKRFGIQDKDGETAFSKLQKISNAQPRSVGIGISACLIVRNEEKHLEKCLESLAGAVDEVVVVDTGSSDRTLEIAGRNGCIIGNFAWCDDFSAARNYALSLATQHWILWIDADETLVTGSDRMLREAAMRPHFGGYSIRIENVMSEMGEADLFVHAPIRLFQRLDSLSFSGRIHEQILPAIESAGLPTAHLNGVVIRHYGYRPSAMVEKDKINRTVSMLLQEIELAPNDAFHWFNLANAYVVSRQFVLAKGAAERCVALIDRDASYGPLAFHLFCTALLECHEPHAVLPACDRADSLGFGGILSAFDRAQAYFAMQEFRDAFSAVNRAIELDWPDDLVGDYGIKTHKSLVLRAQIQSAMHELESALEDVNQALEIDPDFAIARATKGVILSAMDRNQEAIPYLESSIGDLSFGKGSRVCLAKIHLESGRAHDALELLDPLWTSGDHSPEVFVPLVAAYERCNRTREVIELYESYAQTEQPNAAMLVNWGRALLSAGNAESAIQCFSEAAKRDPTDANARFNCGDALYAIGRYQDAAHLYESGLRQNPKYANGWFALGNCFFQMGLLDGADISYREALKFRPIYPEATANLSLVCEQRAAA